MYVPTNNIPPRHSSEIRGLCLMKQNASKFAILLEYENPLSFLRFSLHATLFFPLINVYDQGIN